MSDKNTSETESNKQQSDSQRSSRFRGIADRLDSETDDPETDSSPAGQTRADSQADEANEAEQSSEQTAENIEVGLSRRAAQDDDDSEDETGDSWEWVDDNNETTERPLDSEQSAAASSGTTSSSETAESSRQPGQQESEPSPDQHEPQSNQPELPDDLKDHLEEQDESSVKTDLSNETAAASPELPATDDAEIGSEESSAVGSTTDTVTSDTGSRPDQKSSSRQNQGKTKGRIWDSQSPSTAQAGEPSFDSEFATDIDTAPAGTGEFTDASPEHSSNELPDHVELTPGTTTLVQSGSQDDRTKTICQRLLYDDLDQPQPSVLLVRYQQMEVEQLRQIATEASQTKVISIGYAQDIPAPLEDAVETVNITNPNDITRLGIVVSGTIDQWSKTDRNISFCYESLNVLLNYKDVKSTFRFLHVLLRTLRRGDTVAHFHADPLAGDPQSINTLKPLFDEIISIDSMGVTVE